jgi:peptide/nickel transport system substrate-binding protein
MPPTTLTRRSFIGTLGVGAASLAALSLGGALAGCAKGESPTDDSATAKDALTPHQVIIAMGAGNEPAGGFDPLFGWGASEHAHEPLIQSTLVTTTVDMGFENDLATAYSVSDDGLIWTFEIRDDVCFTNGESLTAADVAFTINSIIASKGAEIDLSMIEEAVAASDTVVTLTLRTPYNALLYTLAVMGIVPEHAYGPDYGDHPIGSGRYMLEQWDKGQQVIFKANPDYYGTPVKMERVVVVFMEDDASLAAARSGQVDVASTTAVYSTQAIDGYSILACKSVDSRGISLPTDQPGGTIKDGETTSPLGNAVTADVAIRRAINTAIDRQLMVDNVLNGYGTVAYSVCDGMPWASPDMRVETSVEKARQMLEEAGWVESAEGVRTKDGTPAVLEILYPSNDQVRQGMANELANQLAVVGIKVEVKGLGWDDIYPRSFSDPVLWGWGSNSPVELYSLNHSTSSSNFSHYGSSVTDGYLDAALAAPDIKDSSELWRKAQWDGAVGVAPQGSATWVWLANIDHLYFKRDNLVIAAQKLHPHGHGWAVTNNVDQWTWK